MNLFRSFLLLTLFLTSSLYSQIILTSDHQLDLLTNPDQELDLSTGFKKRITSLRKICEKLQKENKTYLTIAFDEFFRQYRDHPPTERVLTPDMDEYVKKIKKIADFAAQFDLGMGLSLLSPLELGPSYKNQTGNHGTWYHYKVGHRDPTTGKFNVGLWQQLLWSNNKGNFNIKLKSYKAYAFKEKKIGNTQFKSVDRDSILPLKDIDYDSWGIGEREPTSYSWDANHGKNNKERSKRVNIYSDGSPEHKGYDRVLVLLEYEVPEIDYFNNDALPFLKSLLKKYSQNDIKIMHFYSDEMHIQQDWLYFDHHDNGQFAQRYFSKSLGLLFNQKYGFNFTEKDLLYFVYGPDIDSNNVLASKNMQYVFGTSINDIHQTFLFRDRYYKLLNHHVVDLFKSAKTYASKLFDVSDFGTFGHASWAEAPTIDKWDNGNLHHYAYKYEYTPNFLWGNTVHQAAAACYDYFKWGEYLEPTRNDFAETGWNDRNYYGAALSTSIGVINRIPKSYPAFWGMPLEVAIRKGAINDAFGGNLKKKNGSRVHSIHLDKIIDEAHRDVDVLILYPMNLVAVEERFGSWITQYGYANYITAEKLLEMGKVSSEGRIVIKDKEYSSVVALFEPIPKMGLLDMMKKFHNNGGNLFWFGPPPIINSNGNNCLSKWENIFNVKYEPSSNFGSLAVGKKINFKNSLNKVSDQTILTSFIIDNIHPVDLLKETKELATCDNEIVGTAHQNAYYFGFRPRDDQSASLGYETRTLFEILNQLGAYPSTGKFPNTNDNTEFVSRNSDYLTTRFPNGTVTITKHYRKHRESWSGGFSRDVESDKIYLKNNPLPSNEINIKDFKVNGNQVDFKGDLTMAFRLNHKEELIAFKGINCKSLKINNFEYKFSNENLEMIVFCPLGKTSDDKILINVKGKGVVDIPLSKNILKKQIKILDGSGQKISFKKNKSSVQINFIQNLFGKDLYLTHD